MNNFEFVGDAPFLYTAPRYGKFSFRRGVNSKYKEPGAQPAGFWGGHWLGIIAPITFIVSLFATGVSIYETNNNGRWYEFVFMLGIGAYAGNGEVRRGVR